MLVLPPRGGAFNDLHLYQYHPIPSYTILYLTYIHLAPLCMCMCVSCIRSCTYVAKLATLQCQVTHSHGAWIHQIRYSLKAVPDFGNCVLSETKVERAWRSILLRTMTFASWRTLKGRFAYMFALAQTRMLLLHAATQHLWQSSLLFCRYKLGVVQPSLAHPLSISCLQHTFATCTWVASPLQLSSIHINPQMCEKLLETFECGWQKWADTCHGNGGVLDILVTPPF